MSDVYRFVKDVYRYVSDVYRYVSDAESLSHAHNTQTPVYEQVYRYAKDLYRYVGDVYRYVNDVYRCLCVSDVYRKRERGVEMRIFHIAHGCASKAFRKIAHALHASHLRAM